MNARSPIVIGAVIVALLVGFGAFLLTRTGSGEPPAAAPPPQPSATPSATAGTPTAAPDPEEVRNNQGATSLKLQVTGCEGCQVTAIPSVATDADEPFAATVESGVALIDVPTPGTLGMSFFVQGEKDGDDTPQRALVLLQPGRIAPGDPVSARTAGEAESAGYCWAGTTLSVATLRFTAEEDKGVVSRVWADPALPTTSAQVKPSGSDKTFSPACTSEG